MTEYIKREDALRRAIDAPIAPVLKGDSVYYEAVIMADDVKNIPAADVRENKRGKWTDESTQSVCGVWFIRIKCSNCGKATGQRYKFCPNCGADMREEESNVNDTETD